MKSVACGGTLTIATTLVLTLLMASPATATPNPPTKLGGEVAVSTFLTNDQYYPNAARRPDGKWIVVWASRIQDGSSTGVYMQMFNSDRTKYGGEVQVHTNTANNQFAGRIAVASDNSFIVTWYSVHTGTALIQCQRFDSSGAKLDGEFSVSSGTGTVSYADVAYLTNGEFVICWPEDASSETHHTMMRRYSPTLVPLSDPVVVNVSPVQTGSDWICVAALAGGGYVVGFYHNYEIMGRLYSPDGTPVGPAFQINSYTSSSQGNPDAAGLPDGGFIVTWRNSGHDGSTYQIVARHYDANGTPVGAEFVVNTYTTYQQNSPEVTTFRDNSFAITWYGTLPWDSRPDIAAQYFDAGHNKVGAQIPVNGYKTSSQLAACIASNWLDGTFGIFYGSYNFRGSNTEYDIVGQWFSADVQPAQVTPACTSACLQYFCPDGKIIDIKVTGVVSNDVWGSSYFSDDSNVAAAAVFSGKVAAGETATVSVKCSGPKTSFTSGSAHGVTTQAFASPWPSSFTFDLGGATQPPSPPSPERCYHEPCAHGKCHVQGTSFDVFVEGVLSNNVWGTEEFSDDSWVGAAAVHQGLLQPGSVGSVTVSCSGARTALTGSSRYGVTSNSFGPWEFTYVLHTGPIAPSAPTADVCVGACLEGNCPDGRELFLRVFGTTSGKLWGDNAPAYTDDTTVSTAAVHAGVVSAGAVAIVKATCKGPQSAFAGGTQNGITSQSYGPWAASFELSSGASMPTVTCGPGDQCLKDACTVAGRVIKVSVTGSTHSATNFWGTVLFTGDSPLSHAAVHTGLVLDGATAVLYATCQGPHDAFTGSTANGVTSSGWNGPWPGSFTLSATL